MRVPDRNLAEVWDQGFTIVENFLDADTLAAEKRLTDALGLTVSIDQRRGGNGTLSIRYRNVDQLDEVLRRLERRH